VLKVFNGRPKNGYLDAYTRVLLLRDNKCNDFFTNNSNRRRTIITNNCKSSCINEIIINTNHNNRTYNGEYSTVRIYIRCRNLTTVLLQELPESEKNIRPMHCRRSLYTTTNHQRRIKHEIMCAKTREYTTRKTRRKYVANLEEIFAHITHARQENKQYKKYGQESDGQENRTTQYWN
jgi:hypothetical protein